jgi:type II secretory pathway component PulF
MGRTSGFLSRLGFLMRQGIPILDALEVLSGATPELRPLLDRVRQGGSLSSALSTLPPPFPRELVPLIAGMEDRGLLPEELEALGVWPDDGDADEVPVARILAHASILIGNGRTIPEALTAALRSGDPEPVKAAIGATLRAAGEGRSLSEALGRFPEVFSAAAQRIVLQMERNGNAEEVFRDLALALSRGWFLPGGPKAAP